MTRGQPITRVAVIHPIESYWLCYGPKDQNFEELEYREQAFADLTKWLLLSHQDFDFISESLFPALTDLDAIGQRMPVGRCTYDVIIVPNLHTIRSTTITRLERFVELGGTVIFAGITPSLIDARTPPSSPMIEGALVLPWSKAKLLSALQPFRDIEMTISESTLYRIEGSRADCLLYQMRQDGDDRFLFICNTDRKEPCPVNIVLTGQYNVQVSGGRLSRTKPESR
jgi:hypothetical protein